MRSFLVRPTSRHDNKLNPSFRQATTTPEVLGAKELTLFRELQGREEAREEWGDDADGGHDERIEKLRDRDQLLGHGIAHAEGDYEYQTERMQDMDEDLRRELEAENDERWGNNHEQTEEVDGDQNEREPEETGSDMDIESDSD